MNFIRANILEYSKKGSVLNGVGTKIEDLYERLQRVILVRLLESLKILNLGKLIVKEEV